MNLAAKVGQILARCQTEAKVEVEARAVAATRTIAPESGAQEWLLRRMLEEGLDLVRRAGDGPYGHFYYFTFERCGEKAAHLGTIKALVYRNLLVPVGCEQERDDDGQLIPPEKLALSDAGLGWAKRLMREHEQAMRRKALLRRIKRGMQHLSELRDE